MKNRDQPAAPQEWEAHVEHTPSGFTKHEAASLKILCSLMTVRGNRTDEQLVVHAAQLTDLWLDKLEVTE
jgi:hypothetical protein